MKTNKSIRLRTVPGKSENIQVKIQQEFDTIDFLSLKITQDEAYRNFCSDYGVVAGRVAANDGFGVENAKVSIFIPLLDEDSQNTRITTIYPYTTPSERATSGIRYNLLPRIGKNFTTTLKTPNSPPFYQAQDPNQYYPASLGNITSLGSFAPGSSWSLVEFIPGENGYSIWSRPVIGNGPDVPVGTFPSKFETLDSDTLLEIYDKYYKYTTRTNKSGDYMIFGVPTGPQIVHMDVDLSDAGSATLNVDDFINLGFAPEQFDGNDFRSSSNLDELPQLETQNVGVDIIPFWGNTEQCEIGITRVDFNLTKTIKPAAILVFQGFTNGDSDDTRLKYNCKDITNGTKEDFRNIMKMKNLPLTVHCTPTGVGGDTVVENFSDGNVVMSIPLYGDKVITNEFGEFEPSNTSSGIPTGGQYRIFVYSQNVLNGDGQNGTATHVIGPAEGINYRYDINSRKRLIYTPGSINASTSADDDSHKRMSITGNQSSGSASYKLRYPYTYEAGSGDDKFGKIGGQGQTPICYGSMYFLRARVRDNGDYCGRAIVSSSGLPGGSAFKYTAIGSVGDGSMGVLDITDILQIFKPFGGFLGESSAYNNVPQWNGINLTNGITNSVWQSYPLQSTADANPSGDVIFNKRLSYDDPSGLNQLITVQNTPPYIDSGEKSREGWYFFFFGLYTEGSGNENSLVKLRDKIGS